MPGGVKMLDDQPVVFPHLVDLWNAFLTLDRTRRWNMGYPHYIELTEIEAYARLYRINDVEDILTMIEFVHKLDAHYISWESEQAKKRQHQ